MATLDDLRKRLRREVARANLRLELRLAANDVKVGDMFTAMAVPADNKLDVVQGNPHMNVVEHSRKLRTCIYLGVDKDGVPIIVSPDRQRLLLFDELDDPIQLVSSVSDAE